MEEYSRLADCRRVFLRRYGLGTHWVDVTHPRDYATLLEFARGIDAGLWVWAGEHQWPEFEEGPPLAVCCTFSQARQLGLPGESLRPLSCCVDYVVWVRGLLDLR